MNAASQADICRLVDLIDLPVGFADDAGMLRHANPPLCELLGCAVPDAGLAPADWLCAEHAGDFVQRCHARDYSTPLATLLGRAAVPVLLRLLPTQVTQGGVFTVSRLHAGMPDALAGEQRTRLEYDAIMDNAPVAIGFSLNRRIVRYNAKFAEIFGFDGDAGLGQPTQTLYPSAAAMEEVSQRAFPLLSTGRPFIVEMPMRRQDDSVFWTRSIAYLVDPHDPPQGTIWIISDITEERSLKAVQENILFDLSAIVDNAAVGILFSSRRTIERCNRRSEEILGYAPGTLAGQPALTIYPSAESYERMGREVGPRLGAGESCQGEWEMRRRDGTLIWCSYYARAVSQDGNDRGTVWIVDDITAAKATRDALKRALREMEAILANASVGILFTRDRHIVRYNPRFAATFGFTDVSGIGLPGRVLYRSDADYAEVGSVAGPLLSQSLPFKQELYMRRQSGEDFWANLIGYVADPAQPAAGTIWIIEDRSDFKASEEALQRANAEQQLILDHSVVGIAFLRHRVIQRCNRRFEEIYGFPPGAMTGLQIREIYVSAEAWNRVGDVAYPLLGRGERYVTEAVHRRRDGEVFWARITGQAIDAADPEEGSIWNFEDISERKIAEESLRESEMLQRAILHSASLLIVSTDSAGRIVSCNPAAERMLGLAEAAMKGHTPAELFFIAEELAAYRQAHADELAVDDVDDFDALLARVQLGAVKEAEWTFRRSDGSCFPVQLAISLLRADAATGQGYLFVAGDITERRQAEEALRRSHDELEDRVRERTIELQAEVGERRRAEERLRHIALHDSLTGLPNRNLLRQRLTESLRAADGGSRAVAVMFIDLDRFKHINDSLGHHVGDGLLRKVAQRLTESLRGDDTVARIGGDEFVVVVPGIEGARQASAIALKILEGLRPVIRVDRHELYITPSIGLCLFPRDGGDVDTLLRNADTAMYQAKAAGRNTYRFFEESMNAAAEQYFQIESSLRRAIERDEFELHYQPIVAGDGTLAALEVLVRWRHPTLGLLAPGHFITVAEESGLIGGLGRLVLGNACAQYRAWEAAGHAPPVLAVNLSPLQFAEADLIGNIVEVLASAGVSPQRIELEITESALMQDGEHTLTTLRQLADLGFQLSIDDFGTGYSSLAYLKRFPVSKLKIDRSFIIDMTTDDNDRAIVRTILALAESLHLRVVAEGVETPEQAAALREMGCDYAQGYLFSRPVPAAEIEARYFDVKTRVAAVGRQT